MAAAGMALLLTARVQLGRSFSVSAQARKLVTTGLYSKIRNPIYVFSALMLCGLAITIGRPWLLLLLVILVPLQIVRARKEEQVQRGGQSGKTAAHNGNSHTRLRTTTPSFARVDSRHDLSNTSKRFASMRSSWPL